MYDICYKIYFYHLFKVHITMPHPLPSAGLAAAPWVTRAYLIILTIVEKIYLFGLNNAIEREIEQVIIEINRIFETYALTYDQKNFLYKNYVVLYSMIS